MFKIISFVFLLVGGTPSMGASLYLSPTGDDISGDGSISNPWQSVSVARDAVRTMISTGLTEDVTVYLSEGVYELDETLTFNTSDSVPSGKTVTYKSQDGAGAAVLKSRSVITNSNTWTYFTNGIWMVDVGTGHDIDTLYEGNRRAIEARYPNRGANPFYPQARAPYLVSEDGGITISNTNRSWITYTDDDFTGVSVTNAARITIFPNEDRNWVLWTCDISSVNTDSKRINFYNYGSQTPIEAFARYFVSGALEYLDAPGEFHYDTQAGYLYYKPRIPGNPAYKDISVPVLKTLVYVCGLSRTSVVRGLVFDGLTFSDTAAIVPALDWWSFDWGLTDAGIIKMKNTSSVLLQECHIKNSGRNGILAVGHNESIRVESSLIENTGVNGIIFCNRFAGGTTDRIRDCVISNCVVRNIGNLSLYASCIGLMSTEDCLVDRCELYDSPRYAVSLRGDALLNGTGFNSMPSSKGNIIRNSWVERCMQDSGDGGALHEAGVNIPGGSCINYFENIYVYNTYSVIGQNDPSQVSGIFLDWPNATMHQSFSNIWVDVFEDADFRVNYNLSNTFYNVSWEENFYPDLMDFSAIGLSQNLPESFGFSAPASEVFRDIVVDNNDPEFEEYGENWVDSNVGRVKAPWLLWPDAPNSRLYFNSFSTNYAVWRPDIAYEGYYDVYVWKFQTNAACADHVVYTVVSDTATNDYIVNQRGAPEEWEFLGTHYFSEGTDGYVLMDGDSASLDKQVRADAVRFTAVYPERKYLWGESFDVGYTANNNLGGQNGWATWYGETPIMQSNSTEGVFIQGVSSDDARAKKQISSSISTNRFVVIEYSASIPDTTSTTLSQNHVGLGSFSSNTMGVNIGLNAAGVFVATNGIAMSGFVYGYLDGSQFIPSANTQYMLKGELNLLSGTVRLFISTDGVNFQQLTVNAAGTVTDIPFDLSQVSGWDAVYVRMGQHVNNRIYNMIITN